MRAASYFLSVETCLDELMKERAFTRRVLESLVDLFRHALELVGFTVVESDLQRPPVRIVPGREDVRRPIYYRVFHWPSQTSSVVVEPSFFGASQAIFFLGSATTSFSLKRSECSFIWW